MRTPISYYGGKQKLAKRIVALIPEHRQYVEPFFGGGAVFWTKAPSKVEAVNDINESCITFWRVLKSRFVELKTELECSLHSEELHRQARAVLAQPADHDEVRVAWAFWVQTNMSFANTIRGGFAFSNSGREPRNTANKIAGLNVEHADRLRHVEIFCRDAINLIQRKDGPDTFFYLDPPYPESDCGHYSDHKDVYYRLLEVLPTIKGRFILSSYPSQELEDVRTSCGFHSRDLVQALAVSGKANAGKTKTECLTMNFVPSEGRLP